MDVGVRIPPRAHATDTVDAISGRIANAVLTRNPVSAEGFVAACSASASCGSVHGVPLGQAGAVDAVHEDRSDLVHRSLSVSRRERREWMLRGRRTPGDGSVRARGLTLAERFWWVGALLRASVASDVGDVGT